MTKIYPTRLSPKWQWFPHETVASKGDHDIHNDNPSNECNVKLDNTLIILLIMLFVMLLIILVIFLVITLCTINHLLTIFGIIFYLNSPIIESQMTWPAQWVIMTCIHLVCRLCQFEYWWYRRWWTIICTIWRIPIILTYL